MKIRYNTATDIQVNWGSNDDPRPHLKTGHMYDLLGIEVHTHHCKVLLTDFPNLKFNSVSFDIPDHFYGAAFQGWRENEKLGMEKDYPYIYYPDSPLNQ